MDRFTPIFSKIVDSSIWDEPLHVRVLFISMLALKDWDQVVRYDEYALHRRANLTLDEVRDALKILSSPDKKRPGQENQGRRIEKRVDGWFLLKGEYYQKMMSQLSRKAYKARWIKEKRDNKRGKALPGEAAYLRSGDENAQERILDEANERVTPKNGLG